MFRKKISLTLSRTCNSDFSNQSIRTCPVADQMRRIRRYQLKFPALCTYLNAKLAILTSKNSRAERRQRQEREEFNKSKKRLDL